VIIFLSGGALVRPAAFFWVGAYGWLPDQSKMRKNNALSVRCLSSRPDIGFEVRNSGGAVCARAVEFSGVAPFKHVRFDICYACLLRIAEFDEAGAFAFVTPEF
jgi:hypothetical protein